MEHGTLLSSQKNQKLDDVVKKLLKMPSRGNLLPFHYPLATADSLHSVRQGKSCTPSLALCNLRSGLEHRLEQQGI